MFFLIMMLVKNITEAWNTVPGTRGLVIIMGVVACFSGTAAGTSPGEDIQTLSMHTASDHSWGWDRYKPNIP
jgi:hypothetical protein